MIRYEHADAVKLIRGNNHPIPLRHTRPPALRLFLGQEQYGHHQLQFNGAVGEAMKFWCEWKKHDVKAHRSKLRADGFTAATCYGALRDFIRICRWVHENYSDVLAPKPKVP